MEITKGKWSLHEKVFLNQSGFYLQSISSEYNENMLVSNAYGGNATEAEANAKLIASAPKLLKALQELVELKQLKFNDGEYPSEEYRTIKPIAWENAKKVLEEILT